MSNPTLPQGETTVISNTVNIHNSNVGNLTVPAKDAEPKPKKSVSSFKNSTRNFTVTQQYVDVKESVVREKKVILHCHGFPGTGKSEIMRKLAEEFPYESNHELYIKWHIEFEDEGHDAQAQLQELVKSLFHSNLITEEAKQRVISDLQRNCAGSLTELLQETKVCVLIIFEDVPLKTPKLLSDLLRWVDKIQENNVPFHIYMATRHQTVLENVESKKISSYRSIRVKGFNEDEGIKYLLSRNQGFYETVSDSEKEAACQVFQRFSGSILGLKTAKGFCERSQISYEEYMIELVEGEEDLHALEVQQLENVYGTNVRHIFQAITLPFRGNDAVNRKVMSCLSYLHYNSIPRELLNKLFYHFLSENGDMRRKFGQSKIKAGQLISMLNEFDLCENGKDLKLHEVVLHAFRVSLSPDDESFKTMVRVLAGSVTKDLREPKTKTKMKSICPHIRVLLFHVKENQTGDKLTQLLLSHLYEVYGSVADDKVSCFKFLSQAFKLVFQILKGIEGTGLTEFIAKYENNEMNEVAEELFESSIRSGDNLERGLITEYESSVLIFQKRVLDFLESRATDKARFSQQIRQKLELCPVMGTDIIESLREAKLFLDEEKHRKVFLAERIVSILHSASRIILYSQQPSIDYKMSLWLSRMATTISRKCREKTGVGLLFEEISVLGGQIPIGMDWCKSLGRGTAEYIIEMKSLMQTQEAGLARKLEECPYENGLIKEVDKYRKMNITRHLIRIRSRLVEVDRKYYEDAVETCRHLRCLAMENVRQWEVARECLIYCGKFYASGAEYELALKCFESFLDDPANAGGQSWPWGIYNFARSVVLLPTRPRVHRAVDLCQAVLQPTTKIELNLRARIESELQNYSKH
ncbi:uncharacterized protein LOC104266850 [Ciona intestinalis]